MLRVAHVVLCTAHMCSLCCMVASTMQSSKVEQLSRRKAQLLQELALLDGLPKVRSGVIQQQPAEWTTAATTAPKTTVLQQPYCDEGFEPWDGKCHPRVRVQVKNLPGFPTDANGDMPGGYQFVSGYLYAGTPPSGRGTMYTHYVCHLPPGYESKPLTLWQNGGPGASSFFGMFQEIGPWTFTLDSMDAQYQRTGVPTPQYNPKSWGANLTSLCAIDSPPPIGFSFCTDGNGSADSQGGPGGDGWSCGTWNDTSFANAYHASLVDFFQRAFPEFIQNKNRVSVFGESYAGIYVPQIIDQLLTKPIDGLNLYGFGVGDGMVGCIPNSERPGLTWCFDVSTKFTYPNSNPGPWWDVMFFFGNGQISNALYRNITKTCADDELYGRLHPNNWSVSCRHLIEHELEKEIGMFGVYDLYDACVDEDIDPLVPRCNNTEGSQCGGPNFKGETCCPEGTACTQEATWTCKSIDPSAYKMNYFPYRAGDGDTGVGVPCVGDFASPQNPMRLWLRTNGTFEALGILSGSNYIDTDNGVGFTYVSTASWVGPIYKKAIDQKLKVLVYEGDVDASGLGTIAIQDFWVPYFSKGGKGTWTPAGWLPESLDLNMTKPWSPWKAIKGRPVQHGSRIEWNHGHVSFVSIRGAGHEVPYYRSIATFQMMEEFLALD